MKVELSTTRTRLAFAAAVLGGLALVAGSPYSSQRAAIDVEALSRSVAREEDHVTALELAQWIKDRKPGLRVLDVRDSAAFEDFHIPGAERVGVDELGRTTFKSGETIVLYSEGGPHAAQGWVFLKALGYRDVYFLKGGLFEWVSDVMNPTISENASDSVKKAFEKQAALSRYFGGVPRVGVPTATPSDAVPLPRKGDPGALTADAVKRLKKRSC